MAGAVATSDQHAQTHTYTLTQRENSTYVLVPLHRLFTTSPLPLLLPERSTIVFTRPPNIALSIKGSCIMMD